MHPRGSETPPDIPGFVRCGSQPAGYHRVLVRAACERAGYPRVRSKLLPISSVIPARGFVPPLGVCGNPLISYLVPAAGINLGPIKFPPARSTAVPLEINPSPLPAPASRAYRLQSAILTKTWGAFGHRSSAHRPLSFPLSFAPSPMHHSVHWMSPAWHRATFSPTSCSLQPILGCRRCPCAVLALGAWVALLCRHRQWDVQLHCLVQLHLAEKRRARHFEKRQPLVLPLPVFSCIQLVQQLFGGDAGLLGREQEAPALGVIGGEWGCWLCSYAGW